VGISSSRWRTILLLTGDEETIVQLLDVVECNPLCGS
jgi:hypothetical protein